MPRAAIGIDLGGTAIKGGCFAADGTELAAQTVPTPQPSEPRAVAAAIARLVQALEQALPAQAGVVALGVGTPGPSDRAGRVARVAINLAGWREVPLADWLEAQTGLPTVVANDANCAGLGEAWLGAARECRDSLLLTLGTGVGGAIILGGELFVGREGAAGELGLIGLDPHGPHCNSGNAGSLEQHLSIGAIRRATGCEPAELGQRAAAGDRAALAFWQDYGRWLGMGLTSLIYVLTPEVIVIGGGVSASAAFFLPTAIAELERRTLPSSRAGLQVRVAALGNRAGMIGAARLAWQMAAIAGPEGSTATALRGG